MLIFGFSKAEQLQCVAPNWLVMGRENDKIHSHNACRKADASSIPTSFVGMVIPTKLLGTVYFDKS